MEHTYWYRQSDKPLFPELEWDKPERRDQAGKLLIIGGHLHSLSAPATAFSTARSTGISSIKIALPDKTKRLVGQTLPEALFLPSTTTGELSHKGEVELLDHAIWASSILLPGDNGRNSETTILFESILRGYQDLAVVTRDAVDILTNNPAQLLERKRTTLVVSFAQLQALVKNYGEPTALSFTMDLVKLVDFLHLFTAKVATSIVTLHQNQIIVAVDGKISTTKLTGAEPKHWRLNFASQAVCYLTWNPLKTFEALTHVAYGCTSQVLHV